MPPEEKSRPAQEIDQLLAALENTRREMEETWAGLEQSSPDLPPAVDPPLPPPPPIALPSSEALRERARDEGYEARRRMLRKLFLRLRDQRQRLDDVRRDLRSWTEQLSVRYGALAKAEAEFAERRNRLEEDRLRRQEEALRDERRRFEEERLRFERERLEEDRRRAAVPPPSPAAAAPAAPARAAAPAAPPAPEAKAPSAPIPRPLGGLSPASDDSTPPPWGAALKDNG